MKSADTKAARFAEARLDPPKKTLDAHLTRGASGATVGDMETEDTNTPPPAKPMMPKMAGPTPMWEADTEAGLCDDNLQSVKILIRTAIGACGTGHVAPAVAFLKGAERSLDAAMKRLEGVELALAAMRTER